jgi:hypothetical protein
MSPSCYSHCAFECEIEESEINEYKRGVDLYRQRGANLRALSLLDKEVAGVTTVMGAVPTTARQAANAQYEQRKKEKAEIRARFEQDRSKFTKPKPVLCIVRKEKLAETTRKIKPKTAEDFETVAEMKCQYDIDREKIAQTKALRLMSEGLFL